MMSRTERCLRVLSLCYKVNLILTSNLGNSWRGSLTNDVTSYFQVFKIFLRLMFLWKLSRKAQTLKCRKLWKSSFSLKASKAFDIFLSYLNIFSFKTFNRDIQNERHLSCNIIVTPVLLNKRLELFCPSRSI